MHCIFVLTIMKLLHNIATYWASDFASPASLLRHFRHQEGSRTVASECRQFFETAQVKLVVLCMCWARPSALFCGWVYFECCTDAAVCEKERSAESEEAFRLLLLIGNVLKTDSKTKPTSKLNCWVIIFIYKLGKIFVKLVNNLYLQNYVKSAKRDIF